MNELNLIAKIVGVVSVISGLVVTWLYTTRKHRLEIERLERQRQNEEQASSLHKPNSKEIQEYASARASKGARLRPRPAPRSMGKLQPVLPVLAIGLIAGGSTVLLLRWGDAGFAEMPLPSAVEAGDVDPVIVDSGEIGAQQQAPDPGEDRSETPNAPVVVNSPTLAMGVVRVNLPIGSNVSVNGEARGLHSGIFVDTLPADTEYTLVFARKGFETQEERITLLRNDTLEIEVRLRPKNE